MNLSVKCSKQNYMSRSKPNFWESKIWNKAIFSFSNLSFSKILNKSIGIFPLGTPHKLKQIIIKRCHGFRVSMKLHSHLIRENQSCFCFVFAFFKKEGISLYPPRCCRKWPSNVVLRNSCCRVITGKNFEK